MEGLLGPWVMHFSPHITSPLSSKGFCNYSLSSLKNNNKKRFVLITFLLVPSNSGLLPRSSHKDISSMRLVSRRVASYKRGSAKHPMVSPHCTLKWERAPTLQTQPRDGDSVFDAPPSISDSSLYGGCALLQSGLLVPRCLAPRVVDVCHFPFTGCCTALSKYKQPGNTRWVIVWVKKKRKKKVKQTDLKCVFPCRFWDSNTFGIRLPSSQKMLLIHQQKHPSKPGVEEPRHAWL